MMVFDKILTDAVMGAVQVIVVLVLPCEDSFLVFHFL